MNDEATSNPGKSNGRALGFKRRLALGTALATSAFLGGYRGYIRRAFADCTTAGGTYTCSGVTTTTQTLNGSPLVVTTDTGFSIDTTGSGGNAFTLGGTGGLAFTDQHNSTIAGYASGIMAYNYGSGVLSITTTGKVSAGLYDGITARNYGTDLIIHSAAVSGGSNYGINARNEGSGALSITATGTVTGGVNSHGILARNEGTDLTIEAASISGGRDGIFADNNGGGALSIKATGKVTGAQFDGINASNEGDGGLKIIATDVSGGSYGINAHNNGGGGLKIRATNVSGGTYGINAHNNGGALSITATGVVTGGTTSDGIYAGNEGTDLKISVATVSGGYSGIFAQNKGSGELSIKATGKVTGGHYGGIFASNDGDGGLTIRVADVSDGTYGIYAKNNGSGALSIKASGMVTGTTAEGIDARNAGNGDLTISVTNVSGESKGIYVKNSSSDYSSRGSLLITATGKVSGANADGIQVINNNYSDNMKVSANDVSGGTYGIRVSNNYGRTSLSITATGTVSGASADGISARNFPGTDLTISAKDVSAGRNGIYAAGANVTINAAAVSGGTNGIFAKSDHGTLSITATGLVEGKSGAGINAYGGFATSSDLTISAAAVSGSGDGIRAVNAAFFGRLSITATGTVTGETGDGVLAASLTGGGMTISTADVRGGQNGIWATSVFGGDLVIDAAAVSGGDNGIFAYNGALAGGPGALSITATGKVTGGKYDGINASNYGSGSLTIDVADVSGYIDGIKALNKNGGALSIDASGTVEGKIGAGISASNERGTTNLTIEAAEVSGGTQGIYARNIGTGAVSITATGKVSGGTDHDGIFVRNNGNRTTIDTEAVSGGWNGINVDNRGIGAVSITAKGTVEGTTGRGISVVNEPGSSDITIVAAAVSGGYDGIFARNVGDGSTFITTTGTVTGKGASGIYARSNASNAILTISTAAVSGAKRGMNVTSFGNGLASITTTGTVTGKSAEGIYVFKASSGDLKISTADVNGATDGIHTLNLGGGAVSVTTNGAVAGATGAGIFVQNNAVAADSTATVTVKGGSAVRGGTNGVETRSVMGRGATVVNAGAITGTTGVLANGGQMTVFNTGIITGTGGTAIDLTGAGHPSTVNQQGGAITGKILLSAASDTVNVTGGTIAGDIVGQGNANLNFAFGGGTFTFAAPYAVTGMAGVNMNSGTVTIAGTIDTDALTVNSGAMIVDGKVNILAGLATVNGGKLVVGDDTHATASLVGGVLVNNGGTLGGIGSVGATTIMAGGIHAPGNSPGTQTINGDYVNHGTLEVDVTPTLSDRVVVNGAVDLTGATLSLLLSPASTADWKIINGPVTIIANDGGDAVTGTFSSVTKRLLFLDPSVDYAGGDGNDVTLKLIRNDVKFADVAHTPNQKATGNGIDSLGWGNPLWNVIALQGDENATRAAFDRLSGEIYASSRSALIEDSHFVRDAVNDRIRAAFGDLSAPAMPVMAYGEGGPRLASPDSPGPVAWGHAFGSWDSFDGNGNAVAMGTSTGGFLAGIDGEIASDIRLGLLTGYSRSSFDINGRASSGSSDNYHLGLYAGGKWNALRLTGGLAYTWHDIKTGRSVAFPGFSDRLTGDYSAGTFQAFSEAGYRIGMGAISFEPFANLAYVNLRTDGFTEKGGVSALHVRGETTGTTFTTLGIHPSSVFDLGGITATAHGTLGWRHAFGDITPISTHAFAGGAPFAIAGVPIAKDAALVEAGLDLNLNEAATLGIAYRGQFGNEARQNGFNARLQVKF